MKLKFTLLLVLLCAIHTLVKAQKPTFEPGYIIRGTDSISGLILRTDEVHLGKGIRFKENSGSETKIFSPEMIKGFGFTSDNFSFGAVEVKLSGPDSLIIPHRFGKMMLKGNVSLYRVELADDELPSIYIKDNNFVYVIEKNSQFFTLIQQEYMLGDQYHLKKYYIATLKSLFQDCSAIKISDRLGFKDKAIIEQVSKYNSCNGADSQITYNYQVKSIVRKGLNAFYGIVSTESGFHSAVSAGYFWDILKPERSTKRSLSIGLNYMYLTYKEDFRQETFTIKEHYLKVPFLIQHNFLNKSNNRPFVHMGLTAVASTNDSFAYLDITPFLNLGMGMYFNRIKIHALLDNYGFGLNSDKIINLGIGYRLDKH